MRSNTILTIVLLFSFLGACNNQTKPAETITKETQDTLYNGTITNTDAYQPENKERLSVAYFASGCFWCVEAIYESVIGVEESISGYAGGHTKSPTYESSNTGKTGHAEAVEIWYDSTKVTFPTLLDVYFASQNSIQKNGQGPDRGSQYRSIVFYQNETEKSFIEEKIAELNKELESFEVAAEVKYIDYFWVAEDYHQNYEELNPSNPYIQNISIPRLKRFKKKRPDLIKESQ